MINTEEFSPESAEGLMITHIPIAKLSDTSEAVLKYLAKGSWEDIHSVYVVNQDQNLIGIVPIAKVLSAENNQIMEKLMDKPKITVTPLTDQEKVVIEAIKYDLKSVPVVDDQGHLLGAIEPDRIIDILHEEHLEDFLRSSGIRGKGSNMYKLLNMRLTNLIPARLPWLVIGLFIGLLGSIIVSRFEEALRLNIALVFFMPIVPYMSGAIGTQTETIFIRSITFLKINLLTYIYREFILGMVVGLIIGLITSIFAYFFTGSMLVATVIGLSLFFSMSMATILGVLIPLSLKKMGKDPAVGSGPFITAIQDLISLTIYFLVAILLL